MNRSATELNHLDLGGVRLKKRAIQMLDSMMKSPQSSLPKAFQTWSKMLAAYRFLSNESVSYEALVTPHYEATECRIRQQNSPVILCIQDTTELDFNGQGTDGLGRIIL